AAQRLFDKELITQPDGGYLTSLGRDAAQNVQTVLTILTVEETA
ncbi:MAG: TIGR02647 family protein, partial [Pseudomonas sp.]